MSHLILACYQAKRNRMEPEPEEAHVRCIQKAGQAV